MVAKRVAFRGDVTQCSWLAACPVLGSSSWRDMPAEQADIRWIERRTAVIQLDDVVGFEVRRMLAAGPAILASFELELGDGGRMAGLALK
jgi:hypothetical protein